MRYSQIVKMNEVYDESLVKVKELHFGNYPSKARKHQAGLPEWVVVLWTRKRRKVVDQRPVHVWEKRISRIKDRKLRSRISCIVMWDFIFDNEESSELLNQYSDEWKDDWIFEVKEKQVVEKLYGLGYPPYLALDRGMNCHHLSMVVANSKKKGDHR